MLNFIYGYITGCLVMIVMFDIIFWLKKFAKKAPQAIDMFSAVEGFPVEGDSVQLMKDIDQPVFREKSMGNRRKREFDKNRKFNKGGNKGNWRSRQEW